MATIEGLYLTDDRDNLIFEYPISTTSPTFKAIFTTIHGIDYKKFLQNDSIIEISSTEKIYKMSHDKVTLYALIREEVNESLYLKSFRGGEYEDDSQKTGNNGDEYEAFNDNESSNNELQTKKSDNQNSFITLNPNLFFVFLEKIFQVLQEYFGAPLSPIKVEANYDIMCNLMQELLEGGYPYITDSNTLKELVPFKKSFGSKILSTTNQFTRGYGTNLNSSLKGISSVSVLEKSIPWRKPNVRYTNNELFVDVREEINMILSNQPSKSIRLKKSASSIKKLVPTVAVIKGSIDFTSHLSGIPDIQLVLNLNGHYLGIPSFHRCIRTDRWIQNQGLLSFIPPDGKTTIMDYTIDLDQYPVSKTLKYIGLVNVDYKEGLGVKKNEFEILLNLNYFKNVSYVENLKIIIETEVNNKIKILRLSHGDFQTKSIGKFQWIFDTQTSLGINPILRGIVETEGDSYDNNEIGDDNEELDGEIKNIVFPKLIKITYLSKGSLPSGIKVESLKISKGLNEVKAYKGVKYIATTGDFVIR